MRIGVLKYILSHDYLFVSGNQNNYNIAKDIFQASLVHGNGFCNLNSETTNNSFYSKRGFAKFISLNYPDCE